MKFHYITRINQKIKHCGNICHEFKIFKNNGFEVQQDFRNFIYYLLNKLIESNKDFRYDAWTLYFYNVLSS